MEIEAGLKLTAVGGDGEERVEQNEDKEGDTDKTLESKVDLTTSSSFATSTETICKENNKPVQRHNRSSTLPKTSTTNENINSIRDETSSPSSRNRRNKSAYVTADLIREKSPTPSSDGVGEGFREVTVTVTRQITTTTKVGIVNGRRQVQCNICKKNMAESRLANHIRLMHVDDDSTRSRVETVNSGRKVKQTQGKDQQKEKQQKENNNNSDRELFGLTDSAIKPFKCDHCGKSYAIKYTWQQHVKTHIEGRPKCPECGGTFATAFGLFRHRVRNHDVEHNFKVFPCPECSKEFFSSSELALHEQRHSATKEFVCPECQKAFSVKGNLRIHMRTHAKEKLYKCDLCDGTFSHPYSLVSHRRIHTNDLPYKCDICDKNYRSKHQLTSHKSVHTDERRFKCEECPKTFRSRTAFKMHQDEHKGIKRFCCQYCDRKFQCHGNKLKHERRHTGIKNQKCHLCTKAFIEKQELKNHLKTHEKRNQLGNKAFSELKPDETKSEKSKPTGERPEDNNSELCSKQVENNADKINESSSPKKATKDKSEEVSEIICKENDHLESRMEE